MHAPSVATSIIRPRHPFAGVCQAMGSAHPYYGWFAPYRQSCNGWEAMMTLLVSDISPGRPTSLRQLPFIIDTGSPYTIVPRKLVPGSFPRGKGSRPYDLAVCGGIASCHSCAAMLSISSERSTLPALEFGKVELLIAETGYCEEYGLLGLDALRKVIMVSDAAHLSLWPRPSGAKQPGTQPGKADA